MMRQRSCQVVEGISRRIVTFNDERNGELFSGGFGELAQEWCEAQT